MYRSAVYPLFSAEAATRLCGLELGAFYYRVRKSVEYLDNDGVNVKSAIVICGMADEEYVTQRLKFMREGKAYEYERTEDTGGFVGVTV